MKRSIAKGKAGKLPSAAIRVPTTPDGGCDEVVMV